MPAAGGLRIQSQLLAQLHSLSTNDRILYSTSLLGTATLLFFAIKAVAFFRFLFRGRRLSVFRHSGEGSWALVTGASDGIGYAFSEELLSRGFNVLLHGRNEEKLEGVKQTFLKTYPKRSIEIVAADGSKQDTAYMGLASKAKQLPGKLTVLINNLGGVPTRPQYVPLSQISHDDIDVQINVNARFTTHLTKDLLSILQANGPSLILNCGSSGGLVGIPYIATYTATKAYIHNFTCSLRNELVAEGIDSLDVLGLIIGNVESAGNTHNIPFTISSRECAAAGLDKVGSRDTLVSAHWKHTLQFHLLHLLPERLIRKSLIEEMKKRRDAEKKGR